MNEGALPSLTSHMVDLGNGMFYDPRTDQVVPGTGSAAPVAGSAAGHRYQV
jgi:hypothetical protein